MKKGLLVGVLLLCASFSLQAMHREELDEEEAKEKFFESAKKCDVKAFLAAWMSLHIDHDIEDIDSVKDGAGLTVLHRMAEDDSKLFVAWYRGGWALEFEKTDINFCIDIWKKALDLGASIEALDRNGKTVAGKMAGKKVRFKSGRRLKNESSAFLHHSLYVPSTYSLEKFLAISDSSKMTVLHSAALAKNARVLEECVQSHKLKIARDNKGRIPLHYASRSGSVDIIKQLFGEDTIKLKDYDGNTPIHFAGSLKAFDYLSEASGESDVTIQNNQGRSWKQFSCSTTDDPKVKNLCELYKSNDCYCSDSDICDSINAKREEFFRKYHPNG